MKLKLSAFLLCLLTLATTSASIAQTGGSVTGRVLNATTGAYLAGATIAVEGTTLSEVAGEGGAFRVNDVPAGARTLVVSYPGLDSARIAVAVIAGGVSDVAVELSSKIYQLDAFRVSELREGEAAAVARQRAAENIKQVIATDTFGNVADANVGNLLTRLPGISSQRDEGEVHLVSIRGVDPQFNSVMVDGTRLSGATTRSDGLSRAFEVDKVSTNSIESIEVVKAQLPEMDADAIGGTINLKTKSGFDRKGRDVRWAAGANIYQRRAVYKPSGSIAYSDVLGADRRFGLAFNLSYNRTYGPRSAFRAGYQSPSLTAPSPMNDVQTSEDEITLTRIGTGLKLDYKLTPSASIFFNTLYNNYLDDMTQHKMRVRRGTATFVSEAVSQLTGSSTEYEMESRYRTVKTFRFQFGGKAAWRDWTADGDVAWSPSDGFEKREDVTVRVNNTAWLVDKTDRLHYPTFVQTAGPDVRNFDNGFVDGMNRKDFNQQDEIYAAQLNLKRSFATALPTSLKAGLRWREQTKQQNRFQPNYVYVGPDGVAGANAGRNDDNLNRFNGTDGHNYLPLDGRYSVVPAWPDLAAIHRELRANPALFRENVATTIQNSLVNNGSVREEVLATYLQGTVDIGRLNVLAGVRREATTATAKGPVTDTRFVNNAAEAARRFGGRVTVSRNYENYFPSVHTRYRIGPDILARASWSTGIGRAPYGQLIPVTTVNENAGTISRNNAGLNPQFSHNYDLSIERYFARGVGLVSIGAFQKDLRNFIFSATEIIGNGPDNGFDGLYGGYTLTTRVNGGWARVRGLELNYQQSLTFLPGWLGGFGVFANATRLVTRGTYDGTTIRTTIAGFTPRIANAGVSWSRRGTTLRASWNHTGESARGYNANPANITFIEPRNPVDVSLKIRATRWFDVFVDSSNIFNDKSNTFQGRGDRPSDSQIYGVRLAAGMSGAF